MTLRNATGRVLHGILRGRWSYVSVAGGLLIVLIIAQVIANSAALAPSGLGVTLGLASPLIFAAAANTPPALVGGGGVDMSIGPFMSLVGAVVVIDVVGKLGITSPLVILPVALGCGLLSGFLIGLLVAVVRLPPVIVTLCGYLIYIGLALVIAPQPGGSVPIWLAWFGDAGALPLLVVVFLAWWLFTRTPLYDNLMATGGDDRAAYVAGVPVVKIRVLAYMLAGLLAAIAGLSITAVITSADPNVGTDYTLLGIAAISLGGVSLAGGRGGMVGAVVGALNIFLIENFLTYLHMSPFVEQLVYGLVLVIAICSNSIVDRLTFRPVSAVAANVDQPGTESFMPIGEEAADAQI